MRIPDLRLFWQGFFVCGNGAVHKLVVLFVHHASFLVGLEPLNRTPDTPGKRNGSDEIRNETFDFGVVEDGTAGFVAQKRACLLRVDFGDKIGGDMNRLMLYARGIRYRLVYLVPGKRLIGCDMNSVPIA